MSFLIFSVIILGSVAIGLLHGHLRVTRLDAAENELRFRRIFK